MDAGVCSEHIHKQACFELRENNRVLAVGNLGLMTMVWRAFKQLKTTE
jgi:hypothetical protein